MIGLFTSLLNSSGALAAYERVFSAIENNISNANTPGYAKQQISTQALPFNPGTGLPGGVMPGPMLSSRSEYLEQNVRNQQQGLGFAQQETADLGQIQPLFDLTPDSGIPGAMNSFFNSFSQLAVNTDDAASRAAVIAQASQLARAFNQNANGIQQVSTTLNAQLTGNVTQVNQLAGQIAQLNSQYLANAATSSDAGLDAQMHNALESLSQLVNFTLIKTSDGGYNVYLGGQTPLVIGQNQYSIQADLSSPQAAIRDAQGNDVSAQITQGSLGAVLEEKNRILPGYLNRLNMLAQTLADQVNQALAKGVDQSGAAGAPLFNYHQASDAAFTLSVTGITPGQIAAALPSARGGNGNAVAIAHLATAPLLNGFTFTQFYGDLGGLVGRDLNSAQQDQMQYEDTLNQAQQQRASASGVDLNEEAARLIQFQQAYQAAGKLVGVLDSLTQTVIDMIPPSGL